MSFPTDARWSSRCPAAAATILVALLAAAAPAAAGPGCDAIVDFSSQPFGATWGGSAGTPPGVPQFAEDGIAVGFRPNAAGAYGDATIVPPVAVFGDAQTLLVPNIAVGFEMPAGLCIAQVRFRFADFGGIENLTVNGGATYVGELAAAPAAIAPGVLCTVTTSAVPGGVIGTVTLAGAVSSVRVAGQEFLLDDLCLTTCGEPPLECDQLMDFESQAAGTSFGGPVGTPIGAVQFVEDALPARFFPVSSTGAYALATIDPAFAFFGTGTILGLGDISLGVQADLLGCAGGVRFEFWISAGSRSCRSTARRRSWAISRPSRPSSPRA